MIRDGILPLMEKKVRIHLALISASTIACAGIVAAFFFYYQTTVLHDIQTQTEQDSAAREQLLIQRIKDLQDRYTLTLDQLSLSEEERAELSDNLQRQQDKVDEIEDEYNRINDTVLDLVKLGNTDEELLQKYSKIYFLNENYVPSNIKNIDSDFLINGKPLQFHADALPFLKEMLSDAQSDDLQLRIISAYRSFDYQTQLKQTYTMIYGSGANAFSADQGYSEHQLGTTLDFTTVAKGSELSAFSNTDEFAWLEKNAYKYGFVLSYPEDNSYYQYEPWHWRFVGTDLARYLRRHDMHFYSMDQRDINKYLLKIFD